MKHLIIALAVTVPAMISCSSSHSGSAASEAADSITAAQVLQSRLDSIAAAGKVMFGHDDDPVYGHSWVGDEGRSDVLEVAGDYPGIMNWDLGGIEKGDAANLDSVDFARMRAEVIAQDARGGINAFSWHSVNPVDGRDSWACDDTTIVNRLLNDPEVKAVFDSQVRNVARFFNSLTAADGSKIGVIFRPWHEHTGGWFWWG
ncbi:MAG: beta-mannosidase, partial [Muribaculaceae bacterium]|nr:beta-mannosidase [Muribaculaceae bacterium]